MLERYRGTPAAKKDESPKKQVPDDQVMELIPASTVVQFPFDASSPDAWTDRIAAAWAKTVDHLLETGDLLTQAKAKLKHGDFQTLIETSLPFGKRTAQRLMEIAKDQRLRKPEVKRICPTSIPTLVQLTKLTDKQVEKATNSCNSQDQLGEFLKATARSNKSNNGSKPKSVRQTHLKDAHSKDALGWIDLTATLKVDDVIDLLKGDRSSDADKVIPKLQRILNALVE